jgi:putative membrane protein
MKINIKKYMPKALSGVMALTILVSGVAVASYSAGAESVSTKGSAQSADTTSAKSSTASSSDTGNRLSKNETVYVIADANGSPSKVIVSDWIKNTTAAKTFTDVSNLENIENLKGDETYTIDEKNMYEWDADGNDIYYQGTSTKQLPVGLSITYTLDGKKVSSDSLAGKSGKLKIRFDYDNRQYETVKIDGKEEKIYVPFVMLTGMMLDNDNFRNVEVSNGKIINEGDHTFVAGFALPKMQENLDIDSDEFEIPDYVEISADVTDFELSTTLTLAVNDVFSDLDFSKVDDKIDELSDSLDELTDASNQLIDGSSQLYDGLSTLLDKSGDLIDGVNQLYDGAKQINEGADSLNSGAGSLASGAQTLDNGVGSLQSGAETLDNGVGSLQSGASSVDSGVAQLQGYISTLCSGLGTISENSTSLDAGAKQVFDTLLATADTQIAAAGLTADSLTIENYSSVLENLISSLSDDAVNTLAYNTAYETVSATVNSQKDVIRSAVEAEVRKQVTAAVLSSAGYSMSSDEYDTAVAAGQIPEEVQVQVSTAVSTQMNSSSIQATIDSNTDAQIQSLIDTNMQSDEVTSQISAAVSKAQAGRDSLKALKSQLDSYNTFYQGVLAYTAGVDKANQGAQEILNGTGTLKSGTSSLASGASELKSGSTQLKNGTGELKSGSTSLANGATKLKNGAASLDDGTQTLLDGLASLQSGSASLVDGVSQLKDGSMTLTEGLEKFKKEGVDVLVDAVDGDVKGLVNRLKAISQVSANYKSYSGISSDMDGKVDFIYKTDGIEK